MNLRVWAACWMGLLIGIAAAQSSTDPMQSFSDTIVNKQLFLRGFSGDANVHWHWENGKLALQEPRIHALTVMIPYKVKVTGANLEIDGYRDWLFRKNVSSFVLSPAANEIRILIDLDGAGLANVLPKLEEMLFFPSREAALAALPVAYREALPPDADPKPYAPPKINLEACDCAHLDDEACHGKEMTFGMTGYRSPKLLNSVDPEFSEEARRARFSGNVQVGLEIDKTGHTKDIWIIQPTGMGLNEQAVLATSQYHFAPATCHEQPIPTHLFITVRFEAH